LTAGELLRSSSAAETEAVGARIAGTLKPGDVVLVEGELGAGKTTLVRGACRALGVTARVTSPTFAIGHRYEGRVSVSHLDLYRLDGLANEEQDLLADYLGPDRVAFVEWPRDDEPQLAALATIALRIRLRHEGGDHRSIELIGPLQP
jgi:tRNA threonylcarbamoyladenosine biosynthesis protein TsaE